MDAPVLLEPRRVVEDVWVLPAWLPLPALGLLPVNAFLLRGAEPVLVDAGLLALQDDLVAAVAELVDLDDLRWLVLTHIDPDHTGALERLLREAPDLRVVTTFLAMGKQGLVHPLPADRVDLVEVGDAFTLGSRRLVALRPPTWDAPETIGLYDATTRALLCADSFGAVLPAPAEVAEDVSADALRDGVLTWVAIDTPWLELVDEARLGRCLEAVRRLAPDVVLSAHLPPARSAVPDLLALIASARPPTMPEPPDAAALVDAARDLAPV